MPGDVIEMKGERGDDGEIRYTSAPRPPQKPGGNFLGRVLGIALGVAVFLALVFFFVYVILPVILILILWGLIRGFFQKR